MNILRVFPRRTSMTPIDEWSWVGYPPLNLYAWAPGVIHISVTFTWDIALARELQEAWRAAYPDVPVLLGGPAVAPLTSLPFTPGRYIREGVTFTTRGCNNRCPWCLVPEREGPLLELAEIAPGYIIQDNNFLQASPAHRARVYTMLRQQRRAAVFSGGLDARLLTDEVADELRGLRIAELFLAADTDGALPILRRALGRLSWLPRGKRRVYVMVGYNGETIPQAEARLEAVWAAGGLPFCQLYQPADRWIEYGTDWKRLARTWSRPAAMAAIHGAYMRVEP